MDATAIHTSCSILGVLLLWSDSALSADRPLLPPYQPTCATMRILTHGSTPRRRGVASEPAQLRQFVLGKIFDLERCGVVSEAIRVNPCSRLSVGCVGSCLQEKGFAILGGHRIVAADAKLFGHGARPLLLSGQRCPRKPPRAIAPGQHSQHW